MNRIENKVKQLSRIHIVHIHNWLEDIKRVKEFEGEKEAYAFSQAHCPFRELFDEELGICKEGCSVNIGSPYKICCLLFPQIENTRYCPCQAYSPAYVIQHVIKVLEVYYRTFISH
jgi:hypothetical protein